MPPDLYVFPGDPYETAQEVLEEKGGGIWALLHYNYAALGDQWLYDFTDFLISAGIDPNSVPEEMLVYMALLYHDMDKEDVEWTQDSFILSRKDLFGASLEIHFEFPTSPEGTTAVMVTYDNGDDYAVMKSASSGTGLIGPSNSMAFVLPDKDIVMWRSEFEESFTEGAYKGLSAKFVFTYLLISPRNPYDSQTLYYSEQVDMTLPDADKDLNLGFHGSFKLAPGVRFPMSESAKLMDHLPELFRNAEDLESTFGGEQKDEDGWATLVMAFGDDREQFDSFQQSFLNIMFKPVDEQREYFRKIMDLAEGAGLQDFFIDEEAAIEQRRFPSLEQALEAGSSSVSRGYIVTVDGPEYVLYELTTADLIWLAKRAREEETEDLPRYEGIDLYDVEGAEFFELPYASDSSLQDRMDTLARAYFSTEKELHEKSKPYCVLYETASGFYGFEVISEENASSLWERMDELNGVPFNLDISVGEKVFQRVQFEGIKVLPAGKGARIPLIISHDYYEGRTLFMDTLIEMEAAKTSGMSSLMMRKELAKRMFEDPVKTYIFNSMARPNGWTADPEIKRWIGEMGNNGDMAESLMGDFAFGVVVGLTEQKGVKMIEDMMVLLDMMVDMDAVMKMMISSIRSKPKDEQVPIAQLFTEDEEEAKAFVTLLMDDVKHQEYIMGNEVDGFHLDAAAAKLKESRDEIKEFLDDRKGKMTGSTFTINYEEMFLVQDAEFGEELRKDVYNSLGFKLNPKDYPHSRHVNTSWFPDAFHEGGKDYTSLLEQAYINRAVTMDRTNDTLNAVKAVAMLAGVFSLARGAGLWAVGRLGLEGTKLAFVVEALATSIVAGFILQGIKVAMGGEWSWEELGWTIGEAFLMMLFFGYINKLFKLPITQFTVNAFAFIGIGVGKFYLENGRLPEGFEFNLIILESVLMITLLHIGTKLTDRFFRRLFKLHPFNPNIRIIQGEVQRITSELAKESAKEKPNPAKIESLGERLYEQLKLYRDWVEKNAGKFGEAEVKAELEKVDMLMQQYRTARVLDVAQLSLVSQMENAFFYKPGSRSIEVLKAEYGEENVKIDPDTGVGRVTTPEGEFTLLPDTIASEAGTAGVRGEKLTDIFGDVVRMIDLGVYAMAPGARGKIMDHYIKKGGEWFELGNDMYMARYKDGKSLRKIVFVEEKVTLSLETALKMELAKNKAGMEFLRNKLPPKAAEGLELLRMTLFNGKSNKFVLESLKRMQEEAWLENRSLSQELAWYYDNMTLEQAQKVFAKSGKTRSTSKDFKKYDKLFFDKTGKHLNELFPGAELSQLELVSILRYTKNAIELNRGLYGDEVTSIKFKAWETVLNEALSRMQKFEGLVYRGAAYEEAFILRRYKEGETMTEEGFLSTTRLDATADYYMKRAGSFNLDHIQAKFYIYSKTGVYVEEVAWGGPNFRDYKPSSAEVTFRSGIRFKVIKVTKVTDPGSPPRYEIIMREQ